MYKSYEEEEAYIDGKNDYRHGSPDYWRDEDYGSAEDQAYWEGYRELQKLDQFEEQEARYWKDYADYIEKEQLKQVFDEEDWAEVK